MQTDLVRCFFTSFALFEDPLAYEVFTGASGFVARETIQVANLTIAEQPFGALCSASILQSDS